MGIIFQIIISIISYFVLMYLSINLLGLCVRGLFTNPELYRLKSEGHEFIKKEIEKSERADKWLNIVAFVLIILYLYLLFRFLNIWVMLVAIILMATRLPDLIWEIKHGKKLTKNEVRNLPHNGSFYIISFLDWAMLPALFYFLFYFK